MSEVAIQINDEFVPILIRRIRPIPKFLINGEIYKTTNNINGKIYIGYHTKKDSKYLGSGKHFRNAIKKYGKNNFTRIIIDYADNIEDLRIKEIFWIDFYDARNPEIGYNISKGGDGFNPGENHMYGNMSGENHPNYGKTGEASSMWGRKHSEETKQLMSIRATGKGNSMYGKKGENCPNYGKPKSDNHKRKIGDAHRGKVGPRKGSHQSEESKRKIRDGHIGRKQSEEVKERISKSMKEYREKLKEKQNKEKE
jgi:hypothetical protein